MAPRRYSPFVWLGLSCGFAAAAALIGFAFAGLEGAARAVVSGFGLVMLGAAGVVLQSVLRAKSPDEDWTIVVGYVVLRAGAGVSAIWLALGGGAAAGWTMVACVAVYPVWMQIMRRRREVR